MGVVDPVVGVDAEAEAGGELDRDVDSVEGGERGHVLLRGAQARLVSAQQQIGAAIDQHDRVCAQIVLRERYPARSVCTPVFGSA